MTFVILNLIQDLLILVLNSVLYFLKLFLIHVFIRPPAMPKYWWAGKLFVCYSCIIRALFVYLQFLDTKISLPFIHRKS